ncbi:hypothetical protein HQ563_11185 [bacterium]|nr:hypothetical protein [bacterium]
MKRFLTLPLLLLATSALAADVLQEMAKRGEVTYSNVPREVLAFYYPWYGTPDLDGNWVHWGKPDFEKKDLPASLNYPILGPYSSHDPKIVKEHMRMMKDAGVTGVVVSWWGQRDFTDRAMPLILQQCASHGMKATVYYERVPKLNDPATAVADFNYIKKQYGSHRAFLRIGGKPVVVVYGRAMGQLSLPQWADVVNDTSVVAIADGYSPANAMVFDGVHTYNPVGTYANKSLEEIRVISNEASRNWVRLAREHKKISVVTVLPGYDDTKIRSPGLKLDRFEGKLYDIVWEEAIAADPDWVFITTFNELHEGSEIEPTLELGDLYLRKTALHAKRFMKRPPVKVSPGSPSKGGKVSPAEWSALARRYRGVKIGVFGDVTFTAVHLRRLGFKLEFLSWEDIASERVLRVIEYPLLYFCGSERYVRTVKEQGDVIASLKRYLGNGGVMLVVPQMPFPFFYDETGRARNASRELGLPILGASTRSSGSERVGGFESPPAGVKLRFRVNVKALPHLPRIVKFPESGDLRFRPVSNIGLPDGVVYVPLFRAVDARGEWYGDAGAYIERTLPEKGKARLLYVWFRMPDIVPADDLYHDLLSSLRPKLKTIR